MNHFVSTLTELGWTTEEAIALLAVADENNDHPDWSEASAEEIRRHFADLA